MLFKYQIKDFDNWLAESKICNEAKVKFDNWIKKSPQQIIIKRIPPIGTFNTDKNSISWDIYLVIVKVFFDRDEWIKNFNKSKKVPDIKSFHDWIRQCPMDYVIDKRYKTVGYPHLNSEINVPGKALVWISLEVSIIKDNWNNFQNKKIQAGEKITNEMYEKFISEEKTRLKSD